MPRARGLFDRICELPEYYPTRTEIAILERCAGDIAERMGPGADIVEFGAGSLRKVRILLDALAQPHRYLPIDISGEHLAASATMLRHDYPGLEVTPITADYTRRLLLPAQLPGAGQRVGFFPGSTLGNFTPAEALHFLETAAQVLARRRAAAGRRPAERPHRAACRLQRRPRASPPPST